MDKKQRNEVKVYSLLNTKNYIVNYEPLKSIIDKSIVDKKQIFINFEDVYFSYFFLNQIKNHMETQPLFFKYVVFLNNMPLAKYFNVYKLKAE